MGWVRIDDAFNDHPKFALAGPLGLAQWVAGLAYCNRNLTDGFIPRAVAKRLIDWDGVGWRMWHGDVGGAGEDADGLAVSGHLVDAGLWDECDGGYVVHDYHEYQPRADEVRAKRAEARDRMAVARANRRSRDVRANFERTSDEVPAKFDGSSRNPNPKPNTKSTKENSPSSARADDAAFDDFWGDYPRKVGKDAARKAWRRAVARAESPDAIRAGLRKHLPALKSTEVRFQPHPATWLNEGRWQDETPPAGGNGNGGSGGAVQTLPSYWRAASERNPPPAVGGGAG